MAELIAIAVRAKTRDPMQEVPAAKVSLEAGVQGDSRGKPGDRQVTVVSKAAWDAACEELQAEVPWLYRRANLLVDKVDLVETTGKTLRVGNVELVITGETMPCGLMDRQHDGLRQALKPQWRGGVTCRVVTAGEVAVGDPVEIVSGA